MQNDPNVMQPLLTWSDYIIAFITGRSASLSGHSNGHNLFDNAIC